MKTTKQQRRELVGKANKKLSISKQCNLLSVSRSGFYYEARPLDALNLELTKVIDKEYTLHPFRGVPSMTTFLREDLGYLINKKRIERLYRLMDIQALIPGPHTSKGCKEHKKYPYLLRNLKITHINQVWATDITYVPIKGGYLYLIAIIDLYSRYVLNWSLSNTMEAEWCAEVLKDTIKQYGKPKIFNTDQGSQFTSDVFTEVLKDNLIQISMDGKGRATDNIFIERLWRTVKYDDIYLHAYENGLELYQGLNKFFKFYNQQRRHSSIGNKRPSDLFNAA
ncbi:MAG: IS3 family transposase [Bacteroidales bacterium]